MSLNKTDLAFKKLINRQFTTPNRAFYQEVGANTLEIDSGMVYTSPIPTSRAEAISASVVRVVKCALTKDYSGTVSTSSYYMISGSGYSVDASNYNANFTSLGANFFVISSSYVQRNFLSEKYGSQYAVEVRDSSGTQLSSDSSINWYFDYKSGVLHVADPSPSTLPYSITASQYIGSFLSDSSLNGNVGTPEMYGAVGDGTTDDFLAFKHALVSHSIVELGAKTYAVRGYIGMPSNRSLVGKGKDRSVIKLMDNSPYGYGSQIYVIQNTVMQDDVYWTGSSVGTSTGTGSIVVDYRDTSVRDQSPSSPYYQQSQAQAFAGMGYWQHDTSVAKIGARRNVLIEGLTVDCNFDYQARHGSINHSDNPYSASRVAGGYYYIPDYRERVRPTIHAIVLNGENIVVKDVKIVNYGYGVAYATSGPLNYADSATLPVYNENFPLLINGDISVDYTSSTHHRPSDQAGLSLFRGNYAIDCEVLDIANVNLMNPFSNTTAIYVTNQSLNTSNGQSSFSSEGGIFNCVVDPGRRIKTPTASLWSGSYLDSYSYVSSSLKQSAATLAEWLYTSQGSLTGSNGDIAISEGSPAGAYTSHMRKVSGSWKPIGSGYAVQEHYVHAFSGYRVFNSLARNAETGFYLDSWRNNAFVENNQFVDVSSGFRTVVSDIILTSSYKNVVIKDNYVKLTDQSRAYVYGHGAIFYGAGMATADGSSLRHIDNLTIENNLFELPISGSTDVYGSGNVVFRTYPRYAGIWFGSETSLSGSSQRKHRSVSVKNNHFSNWNPVRSRLESTEAFGYNLPIWFAYSTSSLEADIDDPAAGPFPLSINKFKTNFLPNYNISENTYSDAIYPATSSLVPIIVSLQGNGNTFYYPIDQVSKLATFTATSGSIGILFATGSLYGTASYSLNGSGGSSTGFQPWSSGSMTIEMDGSGNLQDEDGNPIESEESSSFITYAGSVSIGTTASAAGYSLYVSRSIKIDGELSQGTASIAFGNWSHAEGDLTYAGGIAAHAEGYNTNSSGSYSHSEGGLTHASGLYAHSEGSYTSASNYAAHAEGYNTIASGQQSHAEGSSTLASGNGSHSEGQHTTASAHYQHVSGKYNVASSNNDDLFIIGSGTENSRRSNIMVVNRKTVYLNNGGYVSGSGFNIVSGSSLCVNTTESFFDRTYWSASLSVGGGVIVKNGILLVTGSESNGGGNNAGSIFVKGCEDAPFLTLGSKNDGASSVQKYGLIQSSGKRLWLAAGTSAGILCIGPDDENNATSIGTTPDSDYTLNIGPGAGTYALRVQGGISSSFFKTPASSSVVVNVTGSMFYSGSNLFIFTGNGSAGGLVGWKTASLGG
jgi:hypothetical protein